MNTSLNISNSNLKGYSDIQIKAIENSSLTISSKKIKNLNIFSRVTIFLNEKLFGKKFVRLKIDKEPIFATISDISKQLGVSKAEIIKAEQENSLEDLLLMGLEGRYYHVKFSTILEYKKSGKLEELRYLEYLAESLYLPLSELLEAKNEGNLQNYLQTAQSVEERYHETCEKLDRLYEEVDGKLVTKNFEDNFQTEMTPQDLETIKKVVRTAYKTLAQHPKGSTTEVEQVISATETHRILIRSSENSFKIIGLFSR